MRRPSIKPLSLALSLLLSVAVLFSLSLPVWADTEVPGDLNGDTLVNSEDITILEAVLNGSQSAAAGVNYDISGNKMVDSKDLIVLKHLVDPSQPALADKLVDGQTDDLLCLIKSVEGGALQSAVVRGDSTKALELNGSTLTVHFSEVQDWSAKGILEMDTLWLSGTQSVTVSLLDKDYNTLGTAGTAAAKEAGWSRIRVPLTGVANREEVLGFTLTVSEDAHVYMDNLSLDIPDEYKITRAEMENALVEMAWNWYFKGAAYQYDSNSLTSLEQHMNYPLSGYSGGKSRLTLFPTLESATSHSSVFTVCSGFAYDMYLSALGYPILGSKLNSLTMTYWRNASYYPDNVFDAEGAYDMTVLRWHDKGQGTSYYAGTSDDYDTRFYTYYKDENGNIVYNNWYDKAEVKAFFENYEENFRPGDIIVSDNPGHTIIYIGNGMIMDVNGGKFNPLTDKMEGIGGKYNMTTGVEASEPYGCVSYRTFEQYFLTPNGAGKTWLDRRLDYPDDGSGKVLESGAIEHNHLVVLRPLNLLTVHDGDNDPGNDWLDPAYKLNTGLLKYQLEHDTTHEVKTSGYHIDQVTQTRLNYPGMNIDRTVNITPYGTAVKGETITYSVKITNNSNEEQYVAFKGEGYAPKAYEDLSVVERIPANTQLASAPGATVDGDTLTWKITVPAGETVEVSYTVTVTGEIGDKIVSGGGWVENIPSNTIENSIGGTKLAADALADFSADGITVENSTDLAEQIYRVTTGHSLQLPTAQELMDIFFSEYEYYTPYGYYLYSGSSGIRRFMYSLNEQGDNALAQAYRNMLVPGYYGGLWCYTDEYNGPSRISELRTEYLEVGDILVYMDLTPSTNHGATSQARVVESSSVLVYLGEGSFAAVDAEGAVSIRTDALAYTEAFMHDLFVCLRPSQVYEDLSAGLPGYTVTWVNYDGTTLETDEDVPYLTLPTYDGTTPSKAADGVDTYIFAGWDKTVEAVTGDVTYTATYVRELAAHKLTDSELNILAAITPEDVQAAFAKGELTSVNIHAAIPWIYQQASITVPADLSTNKIYATRNYLFDSKNGLAVKTSSHDSYNAAYAPMLVTSAYGGIQMTNVPEFDINYLQIGDIFCAAFDKAQTGDTATHYYTYLYQGDGKLLSISTDANVYTWEDVLNKTYNYNEADYGWSYYFVIRPEEHGAPGNRDITLRSLTGAERYRLSKLTTMGYASRFLYGTLPDYYKAVGITVTLPKDNDANSSNMSQDRALAKLFKKVSGVYVPIEPTNDLMRYFQKMLVGVYGGSQFAAADRVDISDAIANGTLQIGDVVTGMHTNTYTLSGAQKSENVPFSALYQGNNTFLVYYYVHEDEAASATMTRTQWTTEQVESLNYLTYFTLRAENIASTHTVTWVNDDGTVLEQDTRIPYFTLPTYDGETPTKAADLYTYTFAGWDKEIERVTGDVTYKATYTYSRDLSASKLTEEELNILANITPEDVKADKPGSNLNAAGPWVYQQANITYDAFATSGTNAGTVLTIYNTATAFFSGSANAKWTLRATVSAPFTTMMVPNTYGGTRMAEAYPAFDLNYLQVGDLFCGMYTYFTNAEQTTTGNVYATYLYQGKGENGEGKFLLIDKTNAAVFTLEEVLSSTHTHTDGVDYGWGCYYVIRPENYNSAKRDITFRALTDAEKYTLSKLTYGSSSRWIHTVVPNIYAAAGIDITMAGNKLSQEAVRNQLFVYDENAGGRIPFAATDDTMRFYQKMMLPCYGGDLMAETVSLADAVSGGILQIGDMVSGTYVDSVIVDEVATSKDSVFAALYQGNGNFLVTYYHWDEEAGAQTVQNVPMTAAQIDALSFKYYYTLRPENLATVTEDSYTITWVGENGEVLETDKSAVCTIPTYDGEAPTKAPTTELTYTFAGWTPLITSVNADVTYTAIFTEAPRPYTVTWLNADGTELEKDEAVPYGTVPTYDGETPTKAAANGYTYTFEGWDVEPAAVTGDTTYTAVFSHIRELTAHKLTNSELNALASITKTDVENAKLKGDNITNVIAWIYQQANIDVSSTLMVSQTIHTARNNIFYTTGGLSPKTSASSDSEKAYVPMLVANSYGGTTIKAGYEVEFDLDGLQIGDIFCGGFVSADSGSAYYVYLYQGNNKFLKVGKTDIDLVSWEDIRIITRPYSGVEKSWNYYYVLRPENYNGAAARDIALRSLTTAEKTALSRLTVSQVPMGSVHLHTTMPRYFQKIGIAMTLPLNASGKTITHDGAVSQLFKTSGGYYVDKDPTDDTMRYFRKMLLDCQGGAKFAPEKQVTMTDAIANEVLQIGDVIVGKYADTEAGTTASSFTALYQGNNNFLVQYQNWDADAGAQAYKTVVLTASQIDGLTFSYYFTLRVSNLAN